MWKGELMNELNTLTLFLSWKCNFFCSHCGFSCGPERNEKMDIQMAKKYIDEASQYKTLNMVAYSGGEPFLYFNEMKELMEYSFNKGLSAGVVTNSSWAHNEKIVCDRLLELKNFGLEEIITSIDDYHLKYVNIKNIENVIKVAVRLGIRVGINILMTLDSIVKQKNLHEIIDIPTEILEDPEKIWVKESSPIRVGRAKEYFQLDSLKHYGEAELINNSCYYVIRNIVVTPDGSTYACCGFGGATEQGPSSITMGV
jgi:MoaA/NifB/PqqE/SkfB family radical SAM enzyme